MASRRILTSILLLGALAAVPASANGAQRRRDGSDGRNDQRQRSEERVERPRERAVPRAQVDNRDVQRQREIEARRQAELNRQRDQWRDNDRWRDDRGNDRWRNNARVDGRPWYSYHPPRTVIVPRVIRPRIVTVVPYRPYVYRPRLSLGLYYGSGGDYPYGYTPRGYYDPIPGRLYGGLRITDAPRDAQVFADGYYVGIVDDFDGVFQHLNLEAGPHHIEVRFPRYADAIVFEVVIQPGRTITYRADGY
jgi:hypothetical protein